MPKAPEPDKVPINSPADLRHEVDALLAVLQLNETEDTWEKINKALKRFQAVVRGGACRFTDDFVAAMRDPRMAKGVCRSLTTERGALSGTALEMVASCTRLGPSFAPLLAVYFPSVLRLFARPNKVYVTRAASTAASIIRNTRLGEVLRFIVLEWRNEGGKSASFREQAAAAVAVMLGCDTGSLAVEKDSLERRIEDLEWVIKTGAVGREATVRADMKKCWEVYRREWPDRVASFTAPMTPTIRKYLKVDQMHSSAPSTSSAPPVRKPNPPPPSATTHAPPPAPPASRPATLLSKSHGPPSTHAPARHPLAASASTRPLPTASSSTAAPNAAPLASVASSSLGIGAPPHRAARVDQPRSVSASASTSSSRSASRNEERDPLSASTSSLHSTVSSATHASRAGFKPTAPSKTAPLASRATRALAASTATGANGMTTMAPPHEPRKARRVVQAAPAVPPPTSSAAPTPAPTATTLARSQTSSTAPTPSAASRSHPPSTSSTASVPAPPGSSHAPFRPKLTSSTVAAAALGATAAAKTRTTGATARPAAPAPVVGEKQRDKENDKPSAPAPIASARPAAVTAPAPPTAPAASTRTRPPRARSPEVARPKAVPSAATLASRERRAARERERERKAAEEAAAEEMRRRGEKEREEERVRREEERKRAVEVPLPVEEEEEELAVEEHGEVAPEAVEGEQEAEEGDVAVVVEEDESREEALVDQQDAAIEAVEQAVEHDVTQDVEQIAIQQPVEPVVVKQDPQPAIIEAVDPVHDEVGMDSDMVVESLPASQATVPEVAEEVAPSTEPDHAEQGEQAHSFAAETAVDDIVDNMPPSAESDGPHETDVSAAQGVAELERVVGGEVQSIELVEEIVGAEQESQDEQDEDEHVLDLPEALKPDEKQAEGYEDLGPEAVVQPAPAYDDLPPSLLLAAVVSPCTAAAEDDCVEEAHVHEDAFAESAERTATPPPPSIFRHSSPLPSLLRISSPLSRRTIDTPPVSTPTAATRDDTPFTPVLRTPSVRFPAPTLAFSPESFQTCSIILDTPPKLDDPPMAVHLPGRAVPLSQATTGSDEHLLGGSESDAEEEDDSVLASPSPASPGPRRSASPSTFASHPQPVFFPDDGDMSGYDADTTFGDEIDEDQFEGGTEASAAEEDSFAETEVAEQSREFVMPLNDTSAYDHLVHGDEAEHDDSGADERDESLASEQTVQLESLSTAPENDSAGAPAQELDEREDEEDDDEEDPQDVLPGSPAGTTLDFSDFGVATSSTPSAANRRPLWDESLLGDESANFELEQSKLRFHDETESEHDLSGASTVLGDLHISSPALPPRTARVFEEPLEDEPTVFKRSLRSRVVTVDLHSSTSKTPGRVTRAMASSGRDVLGEMQA
ncbi:Protein stu-1 [Rhodotorula toruloides]|nr:Protein stu-1 [Rhodotorula toruloides]